MMSDTQIVDTLQALLDEHFEGQSLGFDIQWGKLVVTVRRTVVHEPSRGVISSGRTDVRELFSKAMHPHLVRLVTRQLQKDAPRSTTP